MFIGHFGVALAAKKVAPQTSLGTLIFASQFLDFLWPLFLLLGIEHVVIAPGITKVSPLNFTDYPFSHSLFAILLWAALVAVSYYRIRHDRRGAWVIGLAVVSHWLLDLLVHRPDLPLYPGGRLRMGLGLWNSRPASIAAEALLFAVGLYWYLSVTRPRDGVGLYGFWSLICALVLGWVSALVGGAPPSVTAVAWGGIGMWLVVPWSWWADRHRDLRNLPAHS